MSAVIDKIEGILTEKYSVDNYVAFASEVLEGMQLVAPYNPHKEFSNFSSHIESSTHIGNYTDPDGKKIIVMAVELKRETYVENSRSTQRSYAKKLIENANADAALIAFHTPGDSRWRLSFVRLDYEMKIENGKLKTAENMTPARRYSFLVGKDEPCHTAIDRFRAYLENYSTAPTLDDLENAFSVEAVTKEFFELYCEKFLQLRECLENNRDFIEEAKLHNYTSEQFAKKTMGQIVFLYFLQKKGWLGVKAWPTMLNAADYKKAFFSKGAKSRELIPSVYTQVGEDAYHINAAAIDLLSDEDETFLSTCVHGEPWGTGPHNFMRKLFELSEKKGANFFDDYLEPLFYDALNVNRGEQGYDPALHCRIPFLSGGLFEPIDGYDWEHNRFEVPNELFSNKKDHKDRLADGILDIFDRYNFTMSEDEPLEREVAIDPEMLGKVFENLLDVSDRKSKGAFYTPREIVHYMCQESLINYLTNTMKVSESAIRDFILYGDFMKDEDASVLKRAEKGDSYDLWVSEELYQLNNDGTIKLDRMVELDNALQDVRIADPAVGSGAFPLGMLNEIVRARQNITTYLDITQKIIDPKGAPREIRYRRINDRCARKLKYETVRNCIFAVDIEPSAVDIAQLRLWLALVIDDEITPNAVSALDGHINPLPLPNLECNILCGNSLIDEFEGIKLINESDIVGTSKSVMQTNMYQSAFDKNLIRLIEKQDELFRCDNTDRKKIILQEISALRDELIQSQIDGISDEQRQKYEATKTMASKPYTLWQLDFARVFKEKGGFDIVIGNPPYGLLNKKQNQNTSIKATDEEVKYYKTNSTYLPAKGGMINIFRLFICKSHYLLKENGHLSLIFPMAFMCDLSAYELRKFIFSNEAIEYLEAFPERDDENKRVFRSAKMSVCILGSNRRQEAPNREFPMRINDDKFVNKTYRTVGISPASIMTIDSKSLTIPLVNSLELAILVKMCTNATRMQDYSKCYTGEIDLSLDKKYVHLEENYHRMLRGAQIQRFYITDNISQGDILYLDSDKYLAEVNSPRSRHHQKKRIGMQGITGVNERYRLKMALIDENVFCANSVNYLLPEKDVYYFLGLGNSHLLNWFFKKLSTNSNVNGYEVDNLPVLSPDNPYREAITTIVKKIIAGSREGNQHEDGLEEALNIEVFKLYGLSEEEIKEVEKVYY